MDGVASVPLVWHEANENEDENENYAAELQPLALSLPLTVASTYGSDGSEGIATRTFVRFVRLVFYKKHVIRVFLF